MGGIRCRLHGVSLLLTAGRAIFSSSRNDLYRLAVAVVKDPLCSPVGGIKCAHVKNGNFIFIWAFYREKSEHPFYDMEERFEMDFESALSV